MIAAATASPATAAPQIAAPDGASPAQSATPTDKTADQKLQQMRDAVTKLKSLGNSAGKAGSDIARAKLEALKQRLKMLMMMGGDPKTVAREAAQIAKEIGQAAKAYADAGGGGSADAAAAQAADAATDAAAGGASAPAPDTALDPATPPTATAASSLDPTAPAAPAAAAGAAPTGAKAEASSPAKTAAPTFAARSGLSAPDPVITEAKVLAAQAKAILKAAIERAKRQHASPEELKHDQDKMAAAEKAVDDAAKELSAATASTGYSDSGQAVADPAAASAPSVSVQA